MFFLLFIKFVNDLWLKRDIGGVFSEKQAYAPSSGKSDNGEDYAAYHACLTAEKRADRVKAENSDKSPVECADYGDNQCSFIHNWNRSFL